MFIKFNGVQLLVVNIVLGILMIALFGLILPVLLIPVHWLLPQLGISFGQAWWIGALIFMAWIYFPGNYERIVRARARRREESQKKE